MTADVPNRETANLGIIARQAYTSSGGNSALVDGEEQAIPAEQFITCSEQALMELIEGNPLFEQAGIVVDARAPSRLTRSNRPPI